MLKLTGAFIIFMIKAILSGVGLALGFYIVGKVTGYFDYYMGLFLNDKPMFYQEVGSLLLLNRR